MPALAAHRCAAWPVVAQEWCTRIQEPPPSQRAASSKRCIACADEGGTRVGRGAHQPAPRQRSATPLTRSSQVSLEESAGKRPCSHRLHALAHDCSLSMCRGQARRKLSRSTTDKPEARRTPANYAHSENVLASTCHSTREDERDLAKRQEPSNAKQSDCGDQRQMSAYVRT